MRMISTWMTSWRVTCSYLLHCCNLVLSLPLIAAASCSGALDDLDTQEKEAAESQQAAATPSQPAQPSEAGRPVMGPERPPELGGPALPELPPDLDGTMQDLMVSHTSSPWPRPSMIDCVDTVVRTTPDILSRYFLHRPERVGEWGP